MKKNMFKGTKGMIILVLLVIMVIGYYFYLSNRNVNHSAEEKAEVEIMTESKKALSRDLKSNYPPTPREIVKYFSEITSCYYNEEHDEEELKALGLKMREIYDDELIANQSEEAYLALLKMDIDEYKEKGRTISSYSPSSSVDVEEFTQDGHECAKLYCVYDIKQDGLLYQTTLCFILRKDAEGHYKIFGWKTMPNEEN